MTTDEVILKTNDLMHSLESNIQSFNDGLITASEMFRKNAYLTFAYSNLVASLTLTQINKD